MDKSVKRKDHIDKILKEDSLSPNQKGKNLSLSKLNCALASCLSFILKIIIIDYLFDWENTSVL
ncbi:hypothetical protein YC2023_078018 [Brassica napus]